jgi:hypothetical protein
MISSPYSKGSEKNQIHDDKPDCIYCNYCHKGAIIWVNECVGVGDRPIQHCYLPAAQMAMYQCILQEWKYVHVLEYKCPVIPAPMVRLFCKGQYFKPLGKWSAEEEG